MNASERAVLQVFAAERDRVLIASVSSPFQVQRDTWYRLQRRYLLRLGSEKCRRELRRRIAESVLRDSAKEGWPVFRSYFRCLRRLGFSDPSITVWASAMALSIPGLSAEAKVEV